MARGKLVESSQRRRQEIMMAALECFKSKGFSETTMSDIRERSGASMGSIYHHFESKERLAASLYMEGLKGVHGAIRGVLEETNQAEEGIKRLVRAYIDWFVQNPDLGHYLFQGMGAQYLELEGDKIRKENALLRRDLGGWLRSAVRAPTALKPWRAGSCFRWCSFCQGHLSNNRRPSRLCPVRKCLLNA